MKYVFLIILSTALLAQNSYYINSVSGNDTHAGTTEEAAWKTFARLQTVSLQAGDTVLLQGIFQENLRLRDIGASNKNPLKISSYGKRAKISSGLESGIMVENCTGIVIDNLIVEGCGRLNGNNGNGVHCISSYEVEISNVDASGYLRSGIEIRGGGDIRIVDCYVHENGFAGINVGPHDWQKINIHNVYIARCVADNNPGCPAIKKNHSGNGILIAGVVKGTIEFCEAMNNGWDMPWTGNGPVGIWAWHCDQVVIQYCIAHHNKTSPKGGDGGGFDFDGGVTNSVMQYNLSYNNDGCGYGLFQFPGALPWHSNIVRYNISIDDGNKNGQVGIFVWTATDDMAKAEIYNNTIIQSNGSAVGYNLERPISEFVFKNNIFIVKAEKKGFVYGNVEGTLFENNLYWSPYYHHKGQSQPAVDFDSKSLQIDPLIIMPPSEINVPEKFAPYSISFAKLQTHSPVLQKGAKVDSPGKNDFFRNPLSKILDIGAHQYSQQK